MGKIDLTKPTLFMLYGFPGSGKTHFASQFSETINAAHVQGDRIRYELFETPRNDKQENEIVSHLMDYMTEEFLKSGVSVIYDTNALRINQRRTLRGLARQSRAHSLLIWLQTDPETAYVRTTQRDRRRNDDKFAAPYDRASFDNYTTHMQNPHNEEFLVISGKHTFNTQRSAVIKRLYEMSLIGADNTTPNVVKPGMVNLIPNPTAGRVDMSRRNIIIR